MRLRAKHESNDDTGTKFFDSAVLILAALILFAPSVLYRLTLKSTAWFWWPLAYIGKDPEKAEDPELFWEQTTSSTLAKIRIVLALAAIGGFAAANLISHGDFLRSHELIGVFAYMFVLDWSVPPWQLLTLATSVLPIAIFVWIDLAGRTYRYAKRAGRAALRQKAERQMQWIERASNLQDVLVILFILVSAGHTALYLNKPNRWFTPSGWVLDQAAWVYGDKMKPILTK